MGRLTRKALKDDIRRQRHPLPMSICEALSAEDPVYEISNRLGLVAYEQMTEVESLFFEASLFLADTLNGGFDQCLSNSTGDYFGRVIEFSATYCDPRVTGVLMAVTALFPDGVVPDTRDARNAALGALRDDSTDPLGRLDAEFYALEREYATGLVAMASARQREFVHWIGAQGATAT